MELVELAKLLLTVSVTLLGMLCGLITILYTFWHDTVFRTNEDKEKIRQMTERYREELGDVDMLHRDRQKAENEIKVMKSWVRIHESRGRIIQTGLYFFMILIFVATSVAVLSFLALVFSIPVREFLTGVFLILLILPSVSIGVMGVVASRLRKGIDRI